MVVHTFARRHTSEVYYGEKLCTAKTQTLLSAADYFQPIIVLAQIRYICKDFRNMVILDTYLPQKIAKPHFLKQFSPKENPFPRESSPSKAVYNVFSSIRLYIYTPVIVSGR